MGENYDNASIESIVNYAKDAEGKTIADITGVTSLSNSLNKGEVGNLIQREYFGIPENSSQNPDFEEAGLELKTFGYKESGSKLTADQRLALSKIDFMEFEKEVDFSDSHLYSKCHAMLLMAYLLKTGHSRIDSEIKWARLYEFDNLWESDRKQMIRDYNCIVKKISNGKASELSEGDTEFLGAARTGDKHSKPEEAPRGDKALPRRFALKKSYMTYLLNEYFETGKDFGSKAKKSRGKFRITIHSDQTFEEWLDRKTNSRNLHPNSWMNR